MDADVRKDGWMDESVGGWLNRWMDGCIDERMERMEGWYYR